jgi:hypothetical protein
MWSHYADGHAGLCLEFQVFRKLGIPLDVTYADEFPIVNFLTDSDRKQMEANLLTKAARWSSECEWRIINTDDGFGLRSFAPEILTGIIFGCRMPQADRDLVRQWVAAGPARPEFYEAIARADTFDLDVVPLAASESVG